MLFGDSCQLLRKLVKSPQIHGDVFHGGEGGFLLCNRYSDGH